MSGRMKLNEYIEQAKIELDDFKYLYELGHAENPERWPMEMDDSEWGELELDSRWGLSV